MTLSADNVVTTCKSLVHFYLEINTRKYFGSKDTLTVKVKGNNLVLPSELVIAVSETAEKHVFKIIDPSLPVEFSYLI